MIDHMTFRVSHMARSRAIYAALAGEMLAAAPSCRGSLAEIDAEVGAERFYQALRAAKRLLAHERKLLGHVR